MAADSFVSAHKRKKKRKKNSSWTKCSLNITLHWSRRLIKTILNLKIKLKTLEKIKYIYINRILLQINYDILKICFFVVKTKYFHSKKKKKNVQIHCLISIWKHYEPFCTRVLRLSYNLKYTFKTYSALIR